MEAAKNKTVEKSALSRLGNARRRCFALRMAPMVDMVFLLLIFFLVAAKWRPEEDFLPFQLATAQAQDARLGRPEPLVIQIRATQTGP